ncbi:MAG: S8 family serine peptidase [bacterium]
MAGSKNETGKIMANALITAAVSALLVSCGGGNSRGVPGGDPAAPGLKPPERPGITTSPPAVIDGEFAALTADSASLIEYLNAKGVAASEVKLLDGGKSASTSEEEQSESQIGLVVFGGGDRAILAEISTLPGVFATSARKRYPTAPIGISPIREPSYLPNDPLFVDAEVDDTTTPPTLIPYQKTTLEHISIEGAWDFARGAGVKIAIIGSGCYSEHPDLAGRISPLSRSFLETGGNVTVGTEIGDEPPSVEGATGTYLAGIAAADLNNSVGMAGVAPEAELLILKTGRVSSEPTDHWEMTDLEISAALKYAADNGASVVLLPLAVVSQPEAESVIEDALAYCAAKNTTIVVPAGDSDPPIEASSVYPANSPKENVIAAGALYLPPLLPLNTSNIDTAGGAIDLAAPGFAVIATDMRPEDPFANPPITGYVYVEGTVPAAALVAGTLALADDALGTATSSPELLKAILFSGIDDWSSLGVPDWPLGAGRLNANRSVAGAKAQISRPVPLVIVSVEPNPPPGKNATATVHAYVRIILGGGLKPYSINVNWGDGTSYPPGTAMAPYNGDTYSHAYSDAGSYPVTIRVRDSAGQERVASHVFNVFRPLTAQISARQEGPGSFKYLFKAVVANSDTTQPTYRWDFNGDGVYDSQLQNPVHEFPSPGTYRVKFYVQDGRFPVFRELDLTVP